LLPGDVKCDTVVSIMQWSMPSLLLFVNSSSWSRDVVVVVKNGVDMLLEVKKVSFEGKDNNIGDCVCSSEIKDTPPPEEEVPL